MIAQKNNLSYKDVFFLKNAFLKRLEKIKRKKILDFEISQEEFVNYIHSIKVAPELSDMNIFCRDNILAPKLRSYYLAQIKKIKSQVISSCQTSDNQHLITKFNAAIQLQYDYVQETMKPDIDCVRIKLYILQQEIKKNMKKNYNTLSMSQGERQRDYFKSDTRPNKPR